jgi:hypothetical protein
MTIYDLFLRLRSPFDMQSLSTGQDSIRQNNTRQTFKVLDKFCAVRYLVDKMLFWTKCYFGILDNFCRR